MKKLSVLVILMGLVMFVTGNAFAYNFYGTYVVGNDSAALLKTLTGDDTLVLLTKYDPPTSTPTPNPFTLTFDPGNTSGTVAVKSEGSGFKGYMAVKAAKGFNLYYFNGSEPIDTPYDWDTNGLNPDHSSPGVSHISFYSSTVPIPAAAWLLGSGLIGLIGARRKFWKKRA